MRDLFSELDDCPFIPNVADHVEVGAVALPQVDDEWQGVLRPRDYQRDAVASIYKAWETSDVATMAVAATGLGKTVIFSEVALRWPIEQGAVMVMAHRRELIYQAAEKFEAHGGVWPSIEMANERASRKAKYVVGSVQTLSYATPCTICRGNGCEHCDKGRSYRIQKWLPEDIGLLIIDEGHHSTAPSYRKVINHVRRNPAAKILLVTATPKRADKIGMHNVVDTICFKKDIREGIDDGWLVPVKQMFVTVDGLDFSKVATRKGDFTDAGINSAMLGEDDSLPSAAELREAAKTRELTPSEVDQIQREEERVHEYVDPVIKEADGRTVLFFASGQEIAKRIAEVCCRYEGVHAEYVIDSTPEDRRRQIIKDFKEGRCQVLVGVGVFLEGFDAPNVDVVAVARPTRSEALYTQIVGRGTRPLPGVVDGPETPEARKEAIASSGKPHVLIIDYCGNQLDTKVQTTASLLAGDAIDEDVELALREAQNSGKPIAMDDAVTSATREREERERLEREQRAKIRAQSSYRKQELDPFSAHAMAPRRAKSIRGSATDKQVALLVKLGVTPEKAETFSKRQAGAVIDKKLSDPSRPPTPKQAGFLKWKGHAVPETFAEASRLIDSIQNGGGR